MKKILVSLFLLIFSLCLVGCEQNQDNSINLHVETFEVEESIYDNVCKEYNIEFRQLYYVIDNYGTYLQLYSLISRKDIEPLDKEGGEQMFKDKVIICYPRVVSYSINFIPVEYSYEENKNEIVVNNQVDLNKEQNARDIKEHLLIQRP